MARVGSATAGQGKHFLELAMFFKVCWRMASYHDGMSMKCDILNIQKWCIVFFLHPKKTAEIFRKSHFFLPNSGLPHGKAARHISGRDFFGFQQVFGGGLTRRRGKFSQLWPKTSWKMYWKMSLISDFPTRFVIGFMARWVWLTGFLPSHPPSGHPPGRPSQLCRRCDSDWEL